VAVAEILVNAGLGEGIFPVPVTVISPENRTSFSSVIMWIISGPVLRQTTVSPTLASTLSGFT